MDRKSLEEVCLDVENDESGDQNYKKSDQRGGGVVDRVTQRKKDFTSNLFRMIDRKSAGSQLESNTSKFDGHFRKLSTSKQMATTQRQMTLQTKRVDILMKRS